MVITRDYYSLTLIFCVIYKIKTEYAFEDFSKDKEMFDFSNYSANLKYYDDSIILAVGKMKDETNGAANKNFLN